MLRFVAVGVAKFPGETTDPTALKSIVAEGTVFTGGPPSCGSLWVGLWWDENVRLMWVGLTAAGTVWEGLRGFPASSAFFGGRGGAAAGAGDDEAGGGVVADGV